MDKKYQIIKNKYQILEDGTIVYRIRALSDFSTKTGCVYAGDYGGFVQKEANLSQYRSCWIDKDSVVKGDAFVCGDAMVVDSQLDDNATVCDLALVAGSYISGHAVVSGKAAVLNSMVCDRAVVSGPTRLYRSMICGDACVFEKSCLEGVTIDDCVGSFVKGDKDNWRTKLYKYTMIPLGGALEGLFRLRANIELVNFCAHTDERVIAAGSLGGVVCGSWNLSRYGCCWVDYDSSVLGYASVHDYAFVTGNSILSGNAVACGSALIVDSELRKNAYVAGRAQIKNMSLGGTSRVFGAAQLTGAEDGAIKSKYDIAHHKGIRLTSRFDCLDTQNVLEAQIK